MKAAGSGWRGVPGRPEVRGGEAYGVRRGWNQFMELDSRQRWSVLGGVEVNYLLKRRKEMRNK